MAFVGVTAGVDGEVGLGPGCGWWCCPPAPPDEGESVLEPWDMGGKNWVRLARRPGEGGEWLLSFEELEVLNDVRRVEVWVE